MSAVAEAVARACSGAQAAPDAAALERAILAAHAARDPAALARLYAEAAAMKADAGEGEAAAFLLTHAYVFALEAGAPEAETYRLRLVAEGREA